MRIGFRTWKLRKAGEEFFFASVAVDANWELLGANRCRSLEPTFSSQDTKSVTYPRAKGNPAGENRSGFYHYYDPNVQSYEPTGKGLLGACMCWGRMAGKDGERMFRSEYAQILAVTEPVWSWFPRPQPPTLPSTVTNRLWMAVIAKERLKLTGSKTAFSRYVQTLVSATGLPTENLDTDRLWVQFQANRKQIDQLVATHLAELTKHQEEVTDFEATQARRFREQMPFPVFRSVEELVEYAKKFGDLGPPDRSLREPPQSTGNPWEGILDYGG